MTREHAYRHLPVPKNAEGILRGTIEEFIHEEEGKFAGNSNGSCRFRVVIDQPHRHHSNGNPYRVLVLLSLPGQDVCVSRVRRKGDLIAAVHEAFHTARIRMRRMLDRRRRHQVNGNGQQGKSGKEPEEF